MSDNRIIYTYTDEAPALATHSLLPIIQAFTRTAGVSVETRDISLAGRILASFPENLTTAQQQGDALAELGALAKSPAANIIKLPNISASVPQLHAAIAELQAQGYDIPLYPESPQSDAEREIKLRYARVLGSAVNPVLREGNSDRRVAAAVKDYARKHPHTLGAWSPESKSHVAHMQADDFYGSEQSATIPADGHVRIEFRDASGQCRILKDKTAVQANEVIDASRMSRRALRAFFAAQIEDARKSGVLLSLHLKATMMKISDPVMFGHAVEVYFADVFEQFGQLFDELGVDTRNGLGAVYAKLEKLPPARRREVEAAIDATYARGPKLAMVDSDKGITNLHVPNDVIIDASMPAALRTSGQMWGPDGTLHDTKYMIPDRCYAGIYQAVIEFCKQHGAFDVRTMGNVANVGLMAQKAEEYGSHDKTFLAPGNGSIRVVAGDDTVLLELPVESGDIWRMCQTRDLPVRDWVRLAVSRARATGNPALFWLDPQRAHDRQLIAKVERYLGDHEIEGLDIRIMSPADAMHFTLERVRAGKDAISVTGNVLRDYLTDLFPILELGTSAKMLSIVPLLAGGGLYETGAGGSAPKHVQQFVHEGHLRWDSLGEFLALAVSLEDLGGRSNNHRAALLAKTLHRANGRFLEEDKSPSRKVGELDNRGSHFYLCLYWAQELAAQKGDLDLAGTFAPFASQLAASESRIVNELNATQGSPVDMGGYYHPNRARADAAMRPSDTFNQLLRTLG